MLVVEFRTSVFFIFFVCLLRIYFWRRVISVMQVSQVIKLCIVQFDYLNFIFNEQYIYYDKQVGFFFLIFKMNRRQMYNLFYIMVIICILQDFWRINLFFFFQIGNFIMFIVVFLVFVVDLRVVSVVVKLVLGTNSYSQILEE